VAEKRTFGVLSVRTIDEEVRTVCAYPRSRNLMQRPHCVVTGSDLMVTEYGSEGRLCPDLIHKLSDSNFRERFYF
jgi:hypothetical protein